MKMFASDDAKCLLESDSETTATCDSVVERGEVSKKQSVAETSGYYDNVREIWVSGSYGRQKVTVHNWRSAAVPVLVTCHCIGMNHSFCFDSFFATVCNYKTVFEHMCVLHIDAIGHHFIDSEETDSLPIDSDDITAIPQLDLATIGTDICTIVESVLSQLHAEYEEESAVKIMSDDAICADSHSDEKQEYSSRPKARRKVIGFGVGLGCHLLHYATVSEKNPFDAVFCVNPLSPAKCGWTQWSMAGALTATLPMAVRSTTLSTLWSLQSHCTLLKALRKSEWPRLDQRFLDAFLLAFVNRTEIEDANARKMKMKSKSELKKKVKGTSALRSGVTVAKECCMQVAYSEWMAQSLQDAAVEFQCRMPRRTTQYTTVKSASFLLTRIEPHILQQPFERFLNTLGLFQETLDRKFGTGRKL